MEQEDDVIWVQGLDDDSVVAFTVDSLVELIKIPRDAARQSG